MEKGEKGGLFVGLYAIFLQTQKRKKKRKERIPVIRIQSAFVAKNKKEEKKKKKT